MKIAIVTVYDSIINYGSFLQAYAMSKVLELKGHEVYFIRRMQNEEILNRFNELAELQNNPNTGNSIKHALLNKKANFLVSRERNANQKRFRCSLKDWQSIKIISQDEVRKKGIQLIVCGSDEIWNKHNKDIDLNFYSCEWIKDIPKLAYAISSGDSKTSEFLQNPTFFDAVGDFNALLPRDLMTQTLIKDITTINEPIVCDPTILLGRDGFALTDAGKNFGRYLLVYSYYLTKKEKKCIKRYARMNNLKIISPCIYSSIADEVIYTSALDFPALISNAECVYTTTFHGTIFSLMYARRFCCMPRLPKVMNMLKQIDCMNYAIDADFSYEDFHEALNIVVDRDKINRGLINLKTNADKLLNEALVSVNDGTCKTLGNRYKNSNKYYYGFSIRENNIRSNSSSGGLFYELARVVLDERGVVFGACFDEKTRKVIHKSSEEVPIEEMLRSKYVESELGDTYKKIEQYLKQGRKVLFCGTPCQAAGLYNLREQKWNIYEKQLYIIDFLCEGVPSKKIFSAYLRDEERKSRKKIKNINFRSKSYGWNTHSILLNYEDGSKKVRPSFVDSYMHTFIMDLLLNRKSCYECVFRNKKYSDITIGDFWKIKDVDTSCSDNKGVSAVFVNSQNGDFLISCIKQHTYLKELKKEYLYYMEQLLDTSTYEEKRNMFYAAFLNEGYNYAIQKYSTYFLNRKIIDKLKLLKIWTKLEYKRRHEK